MVKAKNQSGIKRRASQTLDVAHRRRGRPSGSNRVPLSLDERRARNAMYERERRQQEADALVELSEAVGCSPDIGKADLLIKAIAEIQSRQSQRSEMSLAELGRVNDKLEYQIAKLQADLGISEEMEFT